jgi:CrcB protein
MRNVTGTAVLLVALGGAVGSVLRYLAGAVWPADAAAGAVPWATLGVNVLGAFTLGALLGAVPAGGTARLLVGTGLCGGFTTFSTFAAEGVALAQGGAGARAGSYVMGSVALGLLAAAAGAALGRRLA